MEKQGSNINFGMAFVSPSAKDMSYFKQYLANANPSGKIDVKALGEFVVRQSKNKNIDLQYKHTSRGDVIRIFNNLNFKKLVDVPCGKTELIKLKPKTFMNKLKTCFKSQVVEPERESVGSWDNLPSELKKAGEIANKLQNSL